nr:hypothetical protein Iba_chr02bCG20920 [Ipomoea batatas]
MAISGGSSRFGGLLSESGGRVYWHRVAATQVMQRDRVLDIAPSCRHRVHLTLRTVIETSVLRPSYLVVRAVRVVSLLAGHPAASCPCHCSFLVCAILASRSHTSQRAHEALPP